jgi:hypothetical protein
MNPSSCIEDLPILGEELLVVQLRLANGGTIVRSPLQVVARPTGPDGRIGTCTDPIDPYTGPVDFPEVSF